MATPPIPIPPHAKPRVPPPPTSGVCVTAVALFPQAATPTPAHAHHPPPALRATPSSGEAGRGGMPGGKRGAGTAMASLPPKNPDQKTLTSH